MSIERMAVVLHHSKASGSDKLVLLGIANHDGDGGAWPSVGTLARYSNMSERSVRYSLKRLVELGELQVERQAGGNDKTRPDRRPNRYLVNVECPVDCGGGTQHRLRGEADCIPIADGVKQTAQRGEAGFRNGVKHTAAEPSLEPSGKPLLPRERDTLFDAVATACGIDVPSLTRSSRGALNRAVKELREVNATPDQIANVAKAYKATYPNASLTPMALVKHWASFGAPKTGQRKSVWETYERPEWY
jgi:hypothetical protein